jgi:hypothetical protein
MSANARGVGLSPTLTPGIARAQAQGAAVSVQPYQDGPAGVGQSLDVIAQKIREGQADPDLQGWAADALRAAGYNGRTKVPTVQQTAQAILDQYRKDVLYASDPARTEQVQSASATLCLRGKMGLCLRRGDCDDACVVIGAALLSFAHPIRIVKVPYAQQEHVLVAVQDDVGSNWIYVDGANSDFRAGVPGSPGAPPKVPGEVYVDPMNSAPVGPAGTSGAQLITLGASPKMQSQSQPSQAVYRHNKWWRLSAGCGGNLEVHEGGSWYRVGTGQAPAAPSDFAALKAAQDAQWSQVSTQIQACSSGLTASSQSAFASDYATWQEFAASTTATADDYTRLRAFNSILQVWQLKAQVYCNAASNPGGAVGVGAIHVPGINCNIDDLKGQKLRLLGPWTQLGNDVDNCPLCKDDRSLCAATSAYPNGAPNGMTLTQKTDFLQDFLTFQNWYNADFPICDADAEINQGRDLEQRYDRWRKIVTQFCTGANLPGVQSPDLPPLRNDDPRSPNYVPPAGPGDIAASIAKSVAVVGVAVAAIYGMYIVAPAARNLFDRVTKKK